MPSAKQGLFLALAAFTVIHGVTWWRGARRAARAQDVPPEVADSGPPSLLQLGVGFDEDLSLRYRFLKDAAIEAQPFRPAGAGEASADDGGLYR